MAEVSLLSLPDELLVKIGLELAPDGGRRVGNLRLVNHRIANAVTPIAWLSIEIPRDAAKQDAILSHLAVDRGGLSRCVTSIVYHPLYPNTALPLSVITTLPNLTRLLIYGDRRQPRRRVEHLDAFFKHPTASKHLYSVGFADVSLENEYWLTEALQRIRTKSIRRCIARQLVHDASEMGCTREFEPEGGTDEFQDIIRLSVLGAFIRCRGNHGTLHWGSTTSLPLVLVQSLCRSFGGASKRRDPWSLTFNGLPDMFASPTSDANHLVLFNWIGEESLDDFTLNGPFKQDFRVPQAYSTLRFPSLTTLRLVGSGQPSTNLLNHVTYPSLISLLSLASFPALTTLHLRGWLDGDGVRSLSGLSFAEVARANVYIAGLLAALESLAVTTVALANSDGHADDGVRCTFERKGGGGWRSASTHL